MSVGGVLDSLPAHLQDAIVDPHWTGAKYGTAVPVKFPLEAERAMDTLLQRIKQAGGIPWMETRSDMLRGGLYLFLKLMDYYLTNPPPELTAILKIEAMNAKAVSFDTHLQKTDRTMASRAQQVREMLDIGVDVEELRTIVTDYLTDIDNLGSPFWTKRYKEAIKADKKGLLRALEELGLEGWLGG
jgi:hypothetical protein